MRFEDAIEKSQIDVALTAITLLSPKGRPPLSQEAADLHIKIAELEKISAPLVSFTHLCEASFNLHSVPNPNGHPEGIVSWDNEKQKLVSWDIGSYQMNFLWTHRSLAVGEFSMEGLAFDDIWGKTFYDAEGKPSPFSGDPLSNGRLAARKLLSKKGTERFRAVSYTGPTKQAKRGDLHDLLIPYFEEFFTLYGGT